MKKALAVFVQLVVFLVVFAVFSFTQPLGVHWFVTHPTPTVTRYFVADGFLLATAFLLLVLLAETLGKRRHLVPLSLLGYVLAMVLGLAAKLGFVTHDLLG